MADPREEDVVTVDEKVIEGRRSLMKQQFPGQSPGFSRTFAPDESTPFGTNEQKLEASRRLAVVYAENGEPGFERIGDLLGFDKPAPRHNSDSHFLDVIYRLFLTADLQKVPGDSRKAASHVGGIPPTNGVMTWKESPYYGDPGNHHYAMLIEHLKREYKTKWETNFPVPDKLANGKQRFFNMSNDERVSDHVEAALGAADANLALEEYLTGRSETWKRSWADIKGGGCVEGDKVTPYIVKWLEEFRSKGGCKRECKTCHPQGYNPDIETPYEMGERLSKRAADLDRSGTIDLCRTCDDEGQAAFASADLNADVPSPIKILSAADIAELRETRRQRELELTIQTEVANEGREQGGDTGQETRGDAAVDPDLLADSHSMERRDENSGPHSEHCSTDEDGVLKWTASGSAALPASQRSPSDTSDRMDVSFEPAEQADNEAIDPSRATRNKYPKTIGHFNDHLHPNDTLSVPGSEHSSGGVYVPHEEASEING